VVEKARPVRHAVVEVEGQVDLEAGPDRVAGLVVDQVDQVDRGAGALARSQRLSQDSDMKRAAVYRAALFTVCNGCAVAKCELSENVKVAKQPP
jgi:hypothetical protein